GRGAYLGPEDAIFRDALPAPCQARGLPGFWRQVIVKASLPRRLRRVQSKCKRLIKCMFTARIGVRSDFLPEPARRSAVFRHNCRSPGEAAAVAGEHPVELGDRGARAPGVAPDGADNREEIGARLPLGTGI